ncbi:uncharacterized protein LOC113284609 isoform X1 [Papaver somniferum]|uniref:uncharacterized protein LOC113284609 isoform X1 n=1 Tax=Papaver somniferum TaxID=3469 RepID=UPI000E6F5131|nr:uncharacterized protein LOC113284609 isoform X1 [Papaver somniferum]
MAIYICFPAARKSVGGTRLKKILRNKGKGKKFQEARERGKVARSNVKTPYSTGRKGIPRVEHKMRKKRAQMVRWTDLYRVWLHMSTRITQVIRYISNMLYQRRTLDVMERAMYVGWVARYRRQKYLLLELVGNNYLLRNRTIKVFKLI